MKFFQFFFTLCLVLSSFLPHQHFSQPRLTLVHVLILGPNLSALSRTSKNVSSVATKNQKFRSRFGCSCTNLLKILSISKSAEQKGELCCSSKVVKLSDIPQWHHLHKRILHLPSSFSQSKQGFAVGL